MGAAEETYFPRSVLSDESALSLVSALEMLFQALVPARPALAEELTAAARVYALILAFRDDQGRSPFSLLRTGLAAELDGLNLLELEVDETARKLACRHLRDAAEVAMDVLTASVADDISPEAASSLETHDYRTESIRTELERDSEARNLALLNLRVYIGLYAKTADLQDFAFWSRQALESARFVRPLIPRLVARAHAEMARARSKAAWDDWTDEDVREELDAWRRFA